MKTITELEQKLAEPSARLIEDMKKIKGDILLLGAGGKMGPSLARLAVQAVRASGGNNRVIAVSRYSSAAVREELENAGVHTISADLLDDAQLQGLPDAPNVLYMAGNKFGTTGNEHYTWAMNVYLPGRVAEKYRSSRIVVFSSGNVYPFTPVHQGGASEDVPPSPVGEYGQSCLGRERMFEHFSHKYGTPVTMYRLNYAIDLRYGVLLEVARAVREGRPIDLTMGNANCIWQGDANEVALRALLLGSTPPTILNVTGPETMSMRAVARQFATKWGVEPSFIGTEAPTALLNNAGKMNALLGYPQTSLNQMIDWIADWVAQGGETWNKPTHFQEREGKF